MPTDSDDRRNFIRYGDQSVCEIRINNRTYKGFVVDYSDGLGVIIEDADAIEEGNIADIKITPSGSEMRGQVIWLRKMGSDARVGFKRIGNLKGNLQDFNLADLLIGIQQGTKTGILEIASRSTIKRVFIKNGDMIFSSSNSEDDRLGEMLLRKGRISVEQFNQASERLLDTGEKLGKILVDMACLTPRELFQAARHQVEEIILSLFSVEEGTFEFKEGPLPSDELITLRISAANMIYRGMKRIKSFTRIQDMCPSQDKILVLSRNPIDIFQSISLDAEDKQILYLHHGCNPLKTILHLSPQPDFETLRTISAFIRIGIIKVKKEDDEPAAVSVCDVLKSQDDEVQSQDDFLADVERLYDQCESADYYSFLGIDSNVSEEEVIKAYYRISRQFHPDRHFSFPKHDIKSKLIRICAYASEANTILTDAEKREKYDKSILHCADGTPENGEKSDVLHDNSNLPENPVLSADNGIISDFQEGAAQDFEGDLETHFELGEAYREMGLPEDAIKEFRIASHDPSKKISCCRSIAECYVEQGEYQEAIKELEELAASLDAGDDECLEIKYDLADIFVKNNEHENALKLYGDIQSHNTGYKDVTSKIEALGGM